MLFFNKERCPDVLLPSLAAGLNGPLTLITHRFQGLLTLFSKFFSSFHHCRCAAVGAKQPIPYATVAKLLTESGGHPRRVEALIAKVDALSEEVRMNKRNRSADEVLASVRAVTLCWCCQPRTEIVRGVLCSLCSASTRRRTWQARKDFTLWHTSATGGHCLEADEVPPEEQESGQKVCPLVEAFRVSDHMHLSQRREFVSEAFLQYRRADSDTRGEYHLGGTKMSRFGEFYVDHVSFADHVMTPQEARAPCLWEVLRWRMCVHNAVLCAVWYVRRTGQLCGSCASGMVCSFNRCEARCALADIGQEGPFDASLFAYVPLEFCYEDLSAHAHAVPAELFPTDRREQEFPYESVTDMRSRTVSVDFGLSAV